MPRRQTKPTLWQRFLGIFGLDPFQEKPKKKKNEPSSDVEQTSAKATSTEPAANKRTRTERPKRPPENVAVTSGRLYVGNLSYDATESDLHQLFNGVGIVQSAEVVCHRRTQRSKGYAFVELQSADQAKRAVDELHDKDYMGRKLVISGAKAPQGESSRGAA